jgi:two-component system NtrC family sensor kinase
MIPSFRLIATVILSLGMIILGGLNVQQKRLWVPPVDGVAWVDNAAGQVEARVVEPDGPGRRAGLEAGDVLLGINESPIERDLQVTQVLYDLGVWAQATYHVLRDGSEIETTVVVSPRSERVQNRLTYLEIVGILYLLIGLVVITRRWRAPHATHFYFVCIVSFILYVFHSTGKFNSFDWTIYWSDLVASVLLPPLFLHFCLEFPYESARARGFGTWVRLAYLPGALLLLSEIGLVLGAPDVGVSPIVLRDALYTLNDFHFGLYFVVSAGILAYTNRTAPDPELRQQMKWVTRGTAMAVLPYFAFQSLPRLFGVVPAPAADLALFSLAFIPVSFAWAMHRYRLMDVDILFKRGIAYTLTGVLVVGLYVTLVVVIGDWFGDGLPQLGNLGRILATIVAALLFAPTKEFIQIWLDKFFYKERYDLRVTVADFGRSLGSEKDLGRVLDRIVERLSGSLSIDRMAVLIEDADDASRFVLARAHGLDLPVGTVFPFLKSDLAQPYIFSPEGAEGGSGLHYFVPCRAKGRIIAYLGLGRTRRGEFLTSEDIDLLEGVSDYVGIAVENAALYQSLEVKATQYETLKDFNENIIESIGVGVMVEVDGGIVAWNRALEELTGRSRAEMIGRPTEDAIPEQSLDRLRNERNLYKHRWGNLVVNFSATPLVDKQGEATGRLIMVDDITERVRLEDQLVESDKLTSMGLLAAGVAHEVNTPLAVISSYSQLLRKQLSPGDERSRLMDRIIKQTFRASEIVNNLLSFSRTNATEFAELDVHQVITETLSLLEHQLRNSGVEIERRLSAEAPLAFGNSGKLQQVFLNLFLNARDAMAGGGTLRVRTETAGSRLQVWVEDTGTGISQENIRKIYDPFFTTKERGKGTGLGLSVSYGIIQEHGGNISVESKPGHGTVFRLEFPLARRPVSV